MADFINTRDEMGEAQAFAALVAHTLTELKEDGVTSIGTRALYKNTGLQSVEFPAVTSAGNYAMAECTGLAEAKFPALTTPGTYMFQKCSALSGISLPEATTIKEYGFADCTNLAAVSAPKVTSVAKNAFRNCTKLKSLALPLATSVAADMISGSGVEVVDMSGKVTVAAKAFENAGHFAHLILRNAQLCPLSNVSGLAKTVVINYGWIYVPTDLVDTYKAATNWSTYADHIVSIDEYPKALGNITDTWDEIFAAEDDGSYVTKYSVGDTKEIKIGDTTAIMQIAAINGDTLSDDSGNAPITWVCCAFYGNRAMNATNTTSGGWPATAMRTYLVDTVLPSLPASVRAHIKTVKKTYFDYGSSSVKTSDDAIWLLSTREVCFTGSALKETNGVQYSDLFTDNASRIKYEDLAKSSANIWWLRSANSSANFYYVDSSGTNNYGSASNSFGVVFGFCT